MVLLASFAVGIVLAIQFAWVRRFRNLFSDPPTQPTNESLKVAVFLPLRGADPFLADCLRGLVHQSYSNFSIKIVVDSYDDPAFGEAHRLIHDARPSVDVSIDVLGNRLRTCSLKVSSLLQCIESLDDSYDVLVTIDADAVPHSDWLRELVAPLASDTVGATTGIRWYHPSKRDLGSMVRYQWNICAVVQMHAFNVPWGGSLAMRRSVFANKHVMSVWSNSMCEDTPLALKQASAEREFAIFGSAAGRDRPGGGTGIWRAAIL